MGPVVNVAAIRTEYGKFDDYMKYLATTWKAEQEAAKKMGDVLNYKVITVEPRSENDPDLYLVVTYKNWATQDGAIAKSDALAKAGGGFRGRPPTRARPIAARFGEYWVPLPDRNCS